MTDQTKIELMKIATQLTSDVLDHKSQGIVAGQVKGAVIDINDVFADCLAGVMKQVKKLKMSP